MGRGPNGEALLLTTDGKLRIYDPAKRAPNLGLYNNEYVDRVRNLAGSVARHCG